MSVNSSVEFGSPPSSFRERDAPTTDSRDSKSVSITAKDENAVASDRFISGEVAIDEKNESVIKTEKKNSYYIIHSDIYKFDSKKKYDIVFSSGLIVNFILGDLEFTNLQLFAADINEDSIINIQDVILLINLILN